jgi:hypothetical protein
MYLQKVIGKKNIVFVGIFKQLKKRESRIYLRNPELRIHGLDPYQNVMDPERCFVLSDASTWGRGWLRAEQGAASKGSKRETGRLARCPGNGCRGQYLNI